MTSRAAIIVGRIPTWAWGLGAVGYACAVFFVSSVPSSRIHGSGYLLNLLHAPLFGGLAVLVGGMILSRARPSTEHRALAAAWCLTVGYAALDEFHQSFVPGRHASMADVLTDALGAAFCLVVLRGLTSVRPDPRRLLAWILALGLGILVSAWAAQHEGPVRTSFVPGVTPEDQQAG